MREDIHIVLDSTAVMGETPLKNDPRCHEVHLRVRHGDIEWRDGENDLEEMFALVAKTGILPKTSQPPLGDFLEIFTELVKNGKKVLMLALDGVISGTVQTARLAARQVMSEIPGAQISVIDTLTVAGPMDGIAMAVLQYAETGADFQEVEAYAHDLVSRTETYFTVDTLEYLQKGGRIGSVSALLGNLLGIRPVVHLGANGELLVADKVRTKAKAIRRMLAFAEENLPLEELFIAHVTAREEAEALKKQMTEQFPGVPIMVTTSGAVLACHLGPGTIGVFFRRKKAERV